MFLPKLVSFLAAALTCVVWLSSPLWSQADYSARAERPFASQFQDATIRFDHIDIEDGLNQNSVYAILQDETGFMWFGTQDGLHRYDGYEFRIFTHDPGDTSSISSNWVTSILPGHDKHTIWIGTRDGHLNRFDLRTQQFKRFLYPDNETGGNEKAHIRTLTAGNNGVVWVSIWQDGLYKYHPEENTFKHVQLTDSSAGNELAGQYINHIALSADGLLWVSSRDGIYRQTADDKFKHYHLPSGSKQDEASLTANVILTDHSGTIWAGTSAGLYKYYQEFDDFRPFSASRINAKLFSELNVHRLFEDELHTLWLGTWDSGLFCLSKQRDQLVHFSEDPLNTRGISSNRIQSIFEDRIGLLWIGTSDGGINKFSPYRQKFHHLHRIPGKRNSLSDNMIRAMHAPSEELLWVGTQSGGIDRIDLSDGWANAGFSHIAFQIGPTRATVANQQVSAVYEDRYGTLWVGSWQYGLFYYDSQRQTFLKMPLLAESQSGQSANQIRTIYGDQSGILWIGSNRGLHRLDIKARSSFTIDDIGEDTEQRLSNNIIHSIEKDADGNLWVGTSNGLNFVRFSNDEANDYRNYRITHYYSRPEEPNSLPNDQILALHLSTADILWIGTLDGGLSRFSIRKQDFDSYGKTHGLPNNTIYGIIEDENGYLWLSTNQGLSRFQPETIRFRNFDRRDGLQSDEFNYNAWAVSPEGQFFFGGINGITAFSPQQVTENPHVPPVVFTDFKIFNESVPLPEDITSAQSIQIDHNDNMFTLEFAALDYTAPSKNRYMYKLQGFDPDWTQVTSKNQATYTNLDPGSYLFMVKGSNNDDVWSEAPTTLRLSIRPPFYQTWWFYFLSALLIVGLIYTYVSSRTATIERQRLMLEAKVEDRTRELRQAKEKAEKTNLELERLSLVASETGNGIVITDPRGKIIWINRSFRRMTGYNLEELLKRRGRTITAASTNPDIRRIIKSVHETRKPVVYESKLVHRNGTVIHASSTVTPILNSRGKIKNLVIIDADITEQKKAEEALERTRDELEKRVLERTAELRNTVSQLNEQINERRAAENALASEKERLAVTLRSIGDGVITTDINGNIIMVNEAAESLTGWTQKEAFGKAVSKIMQVDIRDSNLQVLDEEASGSVPDAQSNLRTRLMMKDGRERTIAASTAPIRNKSKLVIGTVLVFRDITEKVRLDEERLRASKLESVGILAGGIAHDFNNILTAILGNINLAQENPNLDRPMAQLLKVTENATLRASALTQQLLTFSQGGLPVTNPVSIAEQVRDSANFVLTGSNVKCQFSIPDDLPAAEVDIGQFSQVLNNLVINADQSMPRGGIIGIDVRTETVRNNDNLANGEYIKVSISDEGPGIPTKHLDKIFDPYFTTKRQGSGLGLATSYSIMRNHNGLITVDTAEGRGTTFHLYLPVSSKEPPPEPVHEPQAQGSGKILIMDDEDDIRNLLKNMLSRIGYAVETAKNGRDAVSMYQHAVEKNEKFDIVIMDLTIPGGMGGQETLRQLKDIDPEVKAIVASGYSNDPIMANYREYGFCGVMAKPFGMKQLNKALQLVEAVDVTTT